MSACLPQIQIYISKERLTHFVLVSRRKRVLEVERQKECCRGSKKKVILILMYDVLLLLSSSIRVMMLRRWKTHAGNFEMTKIYKIKAGFLKK